MEHKKLTSECVAFFKQHPVWKRVFAGFRSKYESYGRFSGKVVVTNLSPEDIEELEGFFGQNYHGKKSATISAEKFTKALSQSKFKEVTPEEILTAFFGEALMGKAEARVLREQRQQAIEQEFLECFSETPAGDMLEAFEVLIKSSTKSNIAQSDITQNNKVQSNKAQSDIAQSNKAHTNKEHNNITDRHVEALEGWKRLLWLCAQIYNALPYRIGEKQYLAVFAARLTGNPHAFDHGTTEGKLLYQVIQKDLVKREIQVEASKIFPAYQRQKSFLLSGILIDDISNYALLSNVHAIKKDGSLHKGIEGFCEEKNMVQVPLNVIAEWESIECKNNEIYIVENPSVFAMLCGEKSCMCMNGQPRLAGLMVLELLARSGTKVYYSGDLDPEGLLIAQKLCQFYDGEFVYWHMKVEDYRACMSKETLSGRRMKMLENVTDEELTPVVHEMASYKMAGYQENICYEQ